MVSPSQSTPSFWLLLIFLMTANRCPSQSHPPVSPTCSPPITGFTIPIEIPIQCALGSPMNTSSSVISPDPSLPINNSWTAPLGDLTGPSNSCLHNQIHPRVPCVGEGQDYSLCSLQKPRLHALCSPTLGHPHTSFTKAWGLHLLSIS